MSTIKKLIDRCREFPGFYDDALAADKELNLLKGLQVSGATFKDTPLKPS